MIGDDMGEIDDLKKMIDLTNHRLEELRDEILKEIEKLILFSEEKGYAVNITINGKDIHTEDIKKGRITYTVES